MIVLLIILYIFFFVRGNYRISKIKNPVKIVGKVSGSEIVADEKKKKTKDIVSFYVDDEMFLATEYSSPVIRGKKYFREDKYEVVYDGTNPSNNMVISYTILSQLRQAFFLVMTIYAIIAITFMFVI